MEEEGIWHIAIDGKRFGSFTASEIEHRIRQGTVEEDAFVLKGGTGEWANITKQPEFSATIAKYKIPPPPNSREKKGAPNYQEAPDKVRKRRDGSHPFGRLFFRVLFAGLLGFFAYSIGQEVLHNPQEAIVGGDCWHVGIDPRRKTNRMV